MPPRKVVGLGLASVLATLLGCPERTDPFPSADADSDVDGDGDGDLGGDAEADADADRDGDVDLDPGPITLVATTAVLSVERRCDHDGDGDLDNVLADLGAGIAELAAMVLNAAVQGNITEGWRLIAHVPWVDDRAGPTEPDGVLIFADATDADDPPDPSDDLLGGERFWVDSNSLDGCGEPRHYFSPLVMDRGVFEAEARTQFLRLRAEVPTRGGRAMGTIAPGGLSCTIDVCCYATINDLGAARMEEVSSLDLSLLEVLLAGGAVYGLSEVPGLLPDLDLDRDGLESFVVDDGFHITGCVDGDLTVIPGPDCWADPRMADGLSLVFHFDGVEALLLGLSPGWRDRVTEPCEEPPEQSLWDAR